MGYTPTHYGPNAVDEAKEFCRQLDEQRPVQGRRSKSTEWEQYQTLYKQGAYDLFVLGWFPDYLDADDYLSPFMVDGGFFQNGYTNPQGQRRWSPRSRARPTPPSATATLGQLQDIAAKDVPLIPSLGRQEHRGRAGRACRASRRPSTRRTSSGSGRSASSLPSTGSAPWQGPAGCPAAAARSRPERPPVSARSPAKAAHDEAVMRAGSLPRYILQRLLLVIPMIWILLTLVFLLLRVAPGDPVTAALGGRLSRRTRSTRAARNVGLDRPLIVQYWDYLGQVATFDFGDDLRQPPGHRRRPGQRRRHPDASPWARS